MNRRRAITKTIGTGIAVIDASAIRAAGGRAEPHLRPGGYHGFDALVPGAARGRSGGVLLAA